MLVMQVILIILKKKKYLMVNRNLIHIVNTLQNSKAINGFHIDKFVNNKVINLYLL